MVVLPQASLKDDTRATLLGSSAFAKATADIAEV